MSQEEGRGVVSQFSSQQFTVLTRQGIQIRFRKSGINENNHLLIICKRQESQMMYKKETHCYT